VKLKKPFWIKFTFSLPPSTSLSLHHFLFFTSPLKIKRCEKGFSSFTDSPIHRLVFGRAVMMMPLGIKPISPKPTVMVYAGPADGLKFGGGWRKPAAFLVRSRPSR
jgi:hypothetical protein